LKVRREWQNVRSDKQVSVRRTRRINCLPWPEPLNVTGQKFATHVAFAPQFFGCFGVNHFLVRALLTAVSKRHSATNLLVFAQMPIVREIRNMRSTPICA
jgi:hypothetical protein